MQIHSKYFYILALVCEYHMGDSNGSDWEHSGKSKRVTAVLAWFVPLGVHHMYLGRYKKGALYALFFWAGASLLCIGQAFHYLIMGEEEFHRRLTMDDSSFQEWKEDPKGELDEFEVN